MMCLHLMEPDMDRSTTLPRLITRHALHKSGLADKNRYELRRYEYLHFCCLQASLLVARCQKLTLEYLFRTSLLRTCNSAEEEDLRLISRPPTTASQIWDSRLRDNYLKFFRFGKWTISVRSVNEGNKGLNDSWPWWWSWLAHDWKVLGSILIPANFLHNLLF